MKKEAAKQSKKINKWVCFKLKIGKVTQIWSVYVKKKKNELTKKDIIVI